MLVITGNFVIGRGLVTTAWLAEHLALPGLRVVDASWYLPISRRDPRAELCLQAGSLAHLLALDVGPFGLG